MMRQQSLPFTERKFVIWLIAFIFFLSASIFIYFLVISFMAEQDRGETFADSVKSALDRTELEHVDEIMRFNGKVPYDVIKGKTGDGEHIFVFVPVMEGEEMKVIYEDDGYSREEILGKWQQTCRECDLIQLTPGYENGQPIWELIYTDNKGQYVFEYYHFHSGNMYEQFILRQTQ